MAGIRGSRHSDRGASGASGSAPADLTDSGRRVSDAPSFSPKDMAGSLGMNGDGVILPTVGYKSPGDTIQFRGVEANTAKMHESGNAMDPMINVYVSPNLEGGTIPGGDSLGVRQLPDSSAMNAGAAMESMRRTADSQSANSYVNPRPYSSYESYGEQPLANAPYTDENSPQGA